MLRVGEGIRRSQQAGVQESHSQETQREGGDPGNDLQKCWLDHGTGWVAGKEGPDHPSEIVAASKVCGARGRAGGRARFGGRRTARCLVIATRVGGDGRITRRRCPRNKLRGEIRWKEIY